MLKKNWAEMLILHVKNTQTVGGGEKFEPFVPSPFKALKILFLRKHHLVNI
jgi:hypothetical protein